MSDTSMITDEYLDFNTEAIPESKSENSVLTNVENVENYKEFEIQVNTYRFYKKQSSSE